jgi:cytochrome c
MKVLRMILISIAIVGLFFACKRTETEEVKAPVEKEMKAEEAAPAKVEAPSYPEAQAPSYAMTGDMERGKKLFKDEKFGNGTAGKSCNSCHPDGKGLEKAGAKSEFNIMGQRQNSLAEAVNFCIKMALKGQPIDPNGQDMKDIVAYIRSLGK